MEGNQSKEMVLSSVKNVDLRDFHYFDVTCQEGTKATFWPPYAACTYAKSFVTWSYDSGQGRYCYSIDSPNDTAYLVRYLESGGISGDKDKVLAIFGKRIGETFASLRSSIRY